ncbi:hypothetical protein, partial [Mycobacterium sp.]
MSEFADDAEKVEVPPPDMGKALSATAGGDSVSKLAAYRKCAERVRAAWPAFAAERRRRLQQGGGGQPVEKIAENILENLFTTVLDWPIENVRPQVERADIVLTRLG